MLNKFLKKIVYLCSYVYVLVNNMHVVTKLLKFLFKKMCVTNYTYIYFFVRLSNIKLN